MKKKLFVFCLAIILVVAIAVPAAASIRQVQQTLSYNDIKITLDGVQIVPKDANGTVIEPFIINGTTYLPVRGIASALGLDVQWDGSTSTVILQTPSQLLASSGTEVYNKDGVVIKYMGVYQWSDDDGQALEYAIRISVQNNTSQEITFDEKSVSVNGYMADSYLYAKVSPGKTAIEDIEIMNPAEKGIFYPFDTIEFTIEGYNSDYETVFESSPIVID